MKAFILWLMGDSLGPITIEIWQWLWSLESQPTPPPTAPTVTAADKAAVEGAEVSIRAMQMQISTLELAVKQVVAAAKLASEQYAAKHRQCQDLEALALAAQTEGDVSAARLAMSQAIIIDRILPQMLERVERAQDLARSAQIKLAQERESLSIAQTEIETLKAMVAMNQSLSQTENFSQSFRSNSLPDRFQVVRSEIEYRNQELETMYELTIDEDQVFSDRELDLEIAKKLKA
jgi:phage shock protein A